MSTPNTAELAFEQAFEECGTRVLAYALRHTDPDSAQDVVADVFLVAWRRVDDLPEDPLPWCWSWPATPWPTDGGRRTAAASWS